MSDTRPWVYVLLSKRDGSVHKGTPQTPKSIGWLRRNHGYDILVDSDQVLVRDSLGYMQIFIHPDLVGGT